MTPETHYPVVEAMIDRFARWLKHRREIAESCNCNSEEYARIAHDLNLSTAELNTLVRRGDDASDELPKMMQALRIDPEAIRRVEPMVMLAAAAERRYSGRPGEKAPLRTQVTKQVSEMEPVATRRSSAMIGYLHRRPA